MRNKFLFALVGVYTFLYMLTSFVINIDTVLMQTIYNLFLIAIILTALHNYRPLDWQWLWLKRLVIFYWFGQVGLFVFNVFKYKDLQEWLDNFNDYHVSIPVYILSIIVAYIYMSKNE